MFQIKKDLSKWAICGTGDSWQLLPEVTDRVVFCLNDYVYTEKFGVKPDLLCIMDILDEKPQVVSGLNNLGDVISRINALKVPLIAPFKYAEIPLSEAFPLEEYIKEFGQPYFLNTIAYMVAYALLKGAKEIELYGVNQASSSEYFYEKASVEYLLGIAIGRGVKVTINGAKSEVLSNKARFGGRVLYGYNQTAEEIFEAKLKFGETVVRKLLSPPVPYSRVIRKIN